MGDGLIRLSKSSISQAEKDAVLTVLDREFLGMGAEVARFEVELSEFFGRPAVCVVNGTAALQLALQGAGLGPGDEVLVQSITYVASFQAISATGARPVACDVEPDHFSIDVADARRRLTPRTKAVMPVHYAGGVGRIEEVYQFAEENKLRVIEDAAHAFGSTFSGRRIGSFGDIACFSFDGIKNITSGEGGCIVTNSEPVLAAVRDARLLGVKGDSEKRRAGARTWTPEVTMQGWLYHMSDIMAAIGRVQLKRFEELKEKRVGLLRRYLSNLASSKLVRPVNYAPDSAVPHIFVVKVLPPADRDTVRKYLGSQGIQTGVHYFPNHRLDYYREHGAQELKCTDVVAGQVLSLPLHCGLSNDDVDLVCDALKKILTS